MTHQMTSIRVLYVPGEHGPPPLEPGLVAPPGGVMQITADLLTLRRLVGGNIELVPGEGWCAFVNEDGKWLGLAVNAVATKLACALGWAGAGFDVLAGAVVFTGPADAGGECTSVPASVLALAAGVADKDREVTP